VGGAKDFAVTHAEAELDDQMAVTNSIACASYWRL
jgi:hypothetical protein